MYYSVNPFPFPLDVQWVEERIFPEGRVIEKAWERSEKLIYQKQ
jgi:hypothetical protein